MSSEEQPQLPVAPLSVGIVGATGMVGELMRSILAERNFPVGSLRLFASARSAGKRRPWQDREIVVEDAETADYAGLDVVFFSAGGAASKKLAPVVAAAGAIVIDNSSAWRSDPKVPLVVAEVNPHALRHIPKGIVANPNCTTMAAMPVLKPLHKAAGLRRLVASTYQAVSGAGLAGVDELEGQMLSAGVGATALVHDGSAVELAAPAKWAVPIAYNVVPLNYRIVENGYSEEEVKLRDESRKILEIPDLAVSGTCVRVPVWTGHSLSMNVEFDRPLPVAKALELLRQRRASSSPTCPTRWRRPAATRSLSAACGPIRRSSMGSPCSCRGDNLRKGAALNAVQIAELLPARPPARRRRALEMA